MRTTRRWRAACVDSRDSDAQSAVVGAPRGLAAGMSPGHLGPRELTSSTTPTGDPPVGVGTPAHHLRVTTQIAYEVIDSEPSTHPSANVEGTVAALDASPAR